jgi:uncharacterized protein YggU (UPF0235/DUF167 family)
MPSTASSNAPTDNACSRFGCALPPTEGEANGALIRLVARALGVPPRDVALAAGATSRIKRVTIAGDGPTLAAALEKIVAVR